jgi:hypothetical protein
MGPVEPFGWQSALFVLEGVMFFYLDRGSHIVLPLIPWASSVGTMIVWYFLLHGKFICVAREELGD